MENRALDLSGSEQVQYKWQAVVGIELLHLGAMKCGKFLDQTWDSQLLKKDFDNLVSQLIWFKYLSAAQLF